MPQPNDILPTKDPDASHPVPTAWRGSITQAVDAIAAARYDDVGRVPGFVALDEATVEQLKAYLADYGAALDRLPAQTWDTSLVQWTGAGWDVLVDLFTVEEGASDLVLELRVVEGADGPRFWVHLVTVP